MFPYYFERIEKKNVSKHQKFVYLFIYLLIFLFIYLFSDSWIRGYVPETEIQGTMTSQFPRKFQVQTSSILWTRWCKLRQNLAEIV